MSALDEAIATYESAKRSFERAQVDYEERLARLAENAVALPTDIRERLEQAAQVHGVDRNALVIALLRIALDEHPEFPEFVSATDIN